MKAKIKMPKTKKALHKFLEVPKGKEPKIIKKFDAGQEETKERIGKLPIRGPSKKKGK